MGVFCALIFGIALAADNAPTDISVYKIIESDWKNVSAYLASQNPERAREGERFLNLEPQVFDFLVPGCLPAETKKEELASSSLDTKAQVLECVLSKIPAKLRTDTDSPGTDTGGEADVSAPGSRKLVSVTNLKATPAGMGQTFHGQAKGQTDTTAVLPAVQGGQEKTQQKANAPFSKQRQRTRSLYKPSPFSPLPQGEGRGEGKGEGEQKISRLRKTYDATRAGIQTIFGPSRQPSLEQKARALNEQLKNTGISVSVAEIAHVSVGQQTRSSPENPFRGLVFESQDGNRRFEGARQTGHRTERLIAESNDQGSWRSLIATTRKKGKEEILSAATEVRDNRGRKTRLETLSQGGRSSEIQDFDPATGSLTRYASVEADGKATIINFKDNSTIYGQADKKGNIGVSVIQKASGFSSPLNSLRDLKDQALAEKARQIAQDFVQARGLPQENIEPLSQWLIDRASWPGKAHEATLWMGKPKAGQTDSPLAITYSDKDGKVLNLETAQFGAGTEFQGSAPKALIVYSNGLRTKEYLANGRLREFESQKSFQKSGVVAAGGEKEHTFLVEKIRGGDGQWFDLCEGLSAESNCPTREKIAAKESRQIPSLLQELSHSIGETPGVSHVAYGAAKIGAGAYYATAGGLQGLGAIAGSDEADLAVISNLARSGIFSDKTLMEVLRVNPKALEALDRQVQNARRKNLEDQGLNKRLPRQDYERLVNAPIDYKERIQALQYLYSPAHARETGVEKGGAWGTATASLGVLVGAGESVATFAPLIGAGAGLRLIAAAGTHPAFAAATVTNGVIQGSLTAGWITGSASEGSELIHGIVEGDAKKIVHQLPGTLTNLLFAGKGLAEFYGAKVARSRVALENKDPVKNAYKTLGLDENAPLTAKLLDTRYKELARQHHPDFAAKTPEAQAAAHQRMIELNLARKTLLARAQTAHENDDHFEAKAIAETGLKDVQPGQYRLEHEILRQIAENDGRIPDGLNAELPLKYQNNAIGLARDIVSGEFRLPPPVAGGAGAGISARRLMLQSDRLASEGPARTQATAEFSMAKVSEYARELLQRGQNSDGHILSKSERQFLERLANGEEYPGYVPLGLAAGPIYEAVKAGKLELHSISDGFSMPEPVRNASPEAVREVRGAVQRGETRVEANLAAGEITARGQVEPKSTAPPKVIVEKATKLTIDQPRSRTVTMAGQPDINRPNLENAYRVFNNSGSQGTIYIHYQGLHLIKVFNQIPGVTGNHIKELVRLNQELKKAGLSVVDMEAVQLSDGQWAVKMPLVRGRPLKEVIDELNPKNLLTNPKAIQLNDKAIRMLDEIDRLTGKMADRRSISLTSDLDDFANFIYTEDGRIINIDPINMWTLMKRAEVKPPAKTATLSGQESGPTKTPAPPLGREFIVPKEPRRPIVSGGRIAGGLSVGRGAEREGLVVDWQKDTELATFYDKLIEPYKKGPYVLSSRAGTLTAQEKQELLQRVFNMVSEDVPFNLDAKQQLKKLGQEGNVLIGACIGNGGACRHQNLLAAAVLERLADEGYLMGAASYDLGPGHGWARFRSQSGEDFIIDVAQQRKVIVPARAQNATFKDHEGTSRRYADYAVDPIGTPEAIIGFRSTPRPKNFAPTPYHNIGKLSPDQPTVLNYEPRKPIKITLGGKVLYIYHVDDLALTHHEWAERLRANTTYVLFDPKDPSQFKGLGNNEVVVLGRQSQHRFKFDQNVSRQHLRITRSGDLIMIEDMGSAQGTTIEIMRLKETSGVEPTEPQTLPREREREITQAGPESPIKPLRIVALDTGIMEMYQFHLLKNRALDPRLQVLLDDPNVQFRVSRQVINERLGATQDAQPWQAWSRLMDDGKLVLDGETFMTPPTRGAYEDLINLFAGISRKRDQLSRADAKVLADAMVKARTELWTADRRMASAVATIQSNPKTRQQIAALAQKYNLKLEFPVVEVVPPSQKQP